MHIMQGKKLFFMIQAKKVRAVRLESCHHWHAPTSHVHSKSEMCTSQLSHCKALRLRDGLVFVALAVLSEEHLHVKDYDGLQVDIAAGHARP